MKRILLIILGWLSTVTAVMGIFLPVVPTVPLLLLAAWCFAHSSKRAHNWLFNHPRLSSIVRQWSEQDSLPRSIKIRAILCIWLGMGLSMLIVQKLWLIIMLATIGSYASIYLWHKPEPDNTIK